MENKTPTEANAGELWFCKIGEIEEPVLFRVSCVGGLVVAGLPSGKGHFFPVSDRAFTWLGEYLQEIPSDKTIQNRLQASNTIS